VTPLEDAVSSRGRGPPRCSPIRTSARSSTPARQKTDDVETAEKRYGDSLRAAVDYGDRFEMTFEVDGIAMALAGQGRDVKAMRLVGASNAERVAQKALVTVEFWNVLKTRYLTPAETRMGEEAAEREKREGRTMGFEAAIDYALAGDRG